MSTVKESLYHTIEELSNEEINKVLVFARDLHQKQERARLVTHLSHDETFTVPAADAIDFQSVQPISGKGKAASKLLVEDRR